MYFIQVQVEERSIQSSEKDQIEIVLLGQG